MTKYHPGVSGNPAGRPKGAIGLITKRRVILESHLPAIVRATQDLAQTGDVRELERCLQNALNDKPCLVQQLKNF